MPSPIYVDGCAYSVGDPQPVESLLREGVLSPEAYEDCVGRGITTYCAGGRSIVEMRNTTSALTIASAGLSPGAIDSVVVPDGTPGCAAFSAGIEAAARQIAAGTAKNVLLLMTGHIPPGMSRYNPELGTVFGDGAAACIVSSRPNGLAVIAAENWVANPSAQAGPATRPLGATLSPGEQMLQDFQRLQNLLKLSYEAARIAPAAVTAVFGTHGSRIYLELMAEAADLPYERVYDGAMHEFGHVFACDNLIALAHFLARRGTRGNRVFALIGWSPRAAGVVLLEEVA